MASSLLTASSFAPVGLIGHSAGGAGLGDEILFGGTLVVIVVFFIGSLIRRRSQEHWRNAEDDLEVPKPE